MKKRQAISGGMRSDRSWAGAHDPIAGILLSLWGRRRSHQLTEGFPKVGTTEGPAVGVASHLAFVRGVATGAFPYTKRQKGQLGARLKKMDPFGEIWIWFMG